MFAKNLSFVSCVTSSLFGVTLYKLAKIEETKGLQVSHP
jgi:hypothetical protein